MVSRTGLWDFGFFLPPYLRPTLVPLFPISWGCYCCTWFLFVPCLALLATFPSLLLLYALPCVYVPFLQFFPYLLPVTDVYHFLRCHCRMGCFAFTPLPQPLPAPLPVPYLLQPPLYTLLLPFIQLFTTHTHLYAYIIVIICVPYHYPDTYLTVTLPRLHFPTPLYYSVFIPYPPYHAMP